MLEGESLSIGQQLGQFQFPTPGQIIHHSLVSFHPAAAATGFLKQGKI